MQFPEFGSVLPGNAESFISGPAASELTEFNKLESQWRRHVL
jgi:hypothetical protein